MFSSSFKHTLPTQSCHIVRVNCEHNMFVSILAPFSLSVMSKYCTAWTLQRLLIMQFKSRCPHTGVFAAQHLIYVTILLSLSWSLYHVSHCIICGAIEYQYACSPTLYSPDDSWISRNLAVYKNEVSAKSWAVEKYIVLVIQHSTIHQGIQF